MQAKIINPSMENHTDSSAYKKDFESGEKELQGIAKGLIWSRNIYDPSVAPLNDLRVCDFDWQ